MQGQMLSTSIHSILDIERGLSSNMLPYTTVHAYYFLHNRVSNYMYRYVNFVRLSVYSAACCVLYYDSCNVLFCALMLQSQGQHDHISLLWFLRHSTTTYSTYSTHKDDYYSHGRNSAREHCRMYNSTVQYSTLCAK